MDNLNNNQGQPQNTPRPNTPASQAAPPPQPYTPPPGYSPAPNQPMPSKENQVPAQPSAPAPQTQGQPTQTQPAQGHSQGQTVQAQQVPTHAQPPKPPVQNLGSAYPTLGVPASYQHMPADRFTLPFRKIHVLFALAAITVCYFLVTAVNYFDISLSATIFAESLLVLTCLWFHVNDKKIPMHSVPCLAISALSGFYFLLSDNAFLKFLNLLFFFATAVYFVLMVSDTRSEKQIGPKVFKDVLTGIFVTPILGFSASPRVLTTGLKKAGGNKKPLYFFLVGMLLMTPVVAIVLTLLMTDTLFMDLIEEIYNHLSNILGELIYFGFAAIVSFFVFGLLYKSLEKKQPSMLIAKSPRKTYPAFLFLGAVTPLVVIYLVYFFSQISYFTSAFSNILPDYTTYAEYARGGFSELSIVCSINAAVIFLMQLIVSKEEQKQAVYRISLSSLSILSIGLGVISIRKMSLYVQVYALTQLRVYTMWFMIFLTLCFLFILFKTFISNINITKTVIITATIFFLTLCYTDTDKIIASYNESLITTDSSNSSDYSSSSSRRLDSNMVYDLGASATPALIRAYEKSGEDYLLERIRRRYEDYPINWRQFNFARYTEQQALTAFFKKYPELLEFD